MLEGIAQQHAIVRSVRGGRRAGDCVDEHAVCQRVLAAAPQRSGSLGGERLFNPSQLLGKSQDGRVGDRRLKVAIVVGVATIRQRNSCGVCRELLCIEPARVSATVRTCLMKSGASQGPMSARAAHRWLAAAS